jgi:hypothetical protein
VQAAGPQQRADGSERYSEGQVEPGAGRGLGADGICLQDEHVQQSDSQAHAQAAQQEAREHQPRPLAGRQQQVHGE